MKHGPRMTRLEGGLTPKQMVMLEIQESLRYPSLEDAAEAECKRMLLSPTLCERIEEAVTQAAGKLNPRALHSKIVGAQREGLFLAKLFSGCNFGIHARLREWELATTLVYAVAALRSSSLRRGRPKKELDEIEATIAAMRVEFRANLYAAELVSREYFDGGEILCPGTKKSVEELIGQLERLLQAHAHGGRSKRGSATRATDHEQPALAEKARTIALHWITFAKAQIYMEFGEPMRAAALMAQVYGVDESG